MTGDFGPRSAFHGMFDVTDSVSLFSIKHGTSMQSTLVVVFSGNVSGIELKVNDNLMAFHLPLVRAIQFRACQLAFWASRIHISHNK